MEFPGKVGAVIPAAGSGQRFGEKKQFKQLGKRPLLYTTIAPFLDCSLISEISVAVPQEDVNKISREIQSIVGSASVTVTAGESIRQNSVRNGINALSDDCDIICIHDCARPLVTEQLIRDTINGCKNHDGCITAMKASDTVKRADGDIITATLNRDHIWLAQTPQAFHRDILLHAFENADNNDAIGTDESALVEMVGGKVKIIEGLADNIKITNQQDWKTLETGLID